MSGEIRYIRPGEKLVDEQKFRARNEAGLCCARFNSPLWLTYQDNLQRLHSLSKPEPHSSQGRQLQLL